MNSRTKNLLLAFGVCLVVVGFGVLDDWFALSEYKGDGIAYLDMANALRQGDWNLALNPYWSIGYPLILFAGRWMFPPGWAGEWTSVHVVNLVIFVAAYMSFLYFIRVAGTFTAKANAAAAPASENQLIFVAGSLMFLEWNGQNHNIAATMPDLMISILYFLLMSASLQFCLRPAAGFAFQMGLLAGLGYITKVAFLPLSFIVFLAVLLRILIGSRTDRLSDAAKLLWALPPMALLILPYVAALSIVQGRCTLGESGSLNYAWTVNGLPHWRWLGGPAPFGEPLHPIRLIYDHPHVYEFGEPLHLTYPPWSNPFYWYDGYHHFFRLKNQVKAVEFNMAHFSQLFFNTPHAPVKTAAAVAFVIAAVLLCTNAKVFWQRLLSIWPVYLPSLLGVGMYMMVYIESRYVVSFLLILLLTPLLVLSIPSPLVGKKTGVLIVILIALIAMTNLVIDESPVFGRAMRNEAYTNNEQWRIGLYLAAHGAQPGTKVAIVRVENEIDATWAYVSGLHIAAQIGNQDFDRAQQNQDFQLFLDSPDVQQTVFDLFRKAGAKLVVVLHAPSAPVGIGWEQVPGTQSWMRWL